MICLFQAAHAADWNNDYGADVTVGYEDNFRLAENNKLDTTSTSAAVYASLAGTTELSSTRIRIYANGKSYSESEIDSSDGYSLSLSTSRRGERLTGSLDLSFTSESTTETELLDSGNVIDGERESVAIAPRLNYQVNEQVYIFASFDASDVTFDTVSLTEYKNNGLSVGSGYQVDETSTATISVRTSEYDPDDDDKTDINSVNLAYEWQTSEATSYRASLGYSDVERPDDSESSGDYGFGIDHTLDERNSFVVDFSNSYAGGSTGDVRDQNQLAVAWIRGLSDRSQMNLSIDAVENDDRNYISLQLGGSYSYTQEISMRGSLRHRREDRDDDSNVYSNAVFFTISYSPI